MNGETVRVLLNTGEESPEFMTVARAKVPAGFIRCQMIEHGECYADPKKLKTTDEPRHGEFPEPIRVVMRRLERVLNGLQTQSTEEWEAGFRCDKHPWTEIALYERIADGLDRFAAHLMGDDEMTRKKRRDLFSLLLVITNEGSIPKGARVGSYETVMANRIREIGDWMFSETTSATFRRRLNAHRDLIMPGRLAGPDRVSLASLFDDGCGPNASASFKPRELIESADVILGVDLDSGREFIAYGRDFLTRAVETESGQRARVLRVELDQDTEDLEKFVALLQVVKGKHDYQPG